MISYCCETQSVIMFYCRSSLMVSAKCLFTQNLLPSHRHGDTRGDNCVSLELKDEFSWCDHPIIKHFPHFLFVIKSILEASGYSVTDPINTCVPGVQIMMSTLRVLNPTTIGTTLFPSPNVGEVRRMF